MSSNIINLIFTIDYCTFFSKKHRVECDNWGKQLGLSLGACLVICLSSGLWKFISRPQLSKIPFYYSIPLFSAWKLINWVTTEVICKTLQMFHVRKNWLMFVLSIHLAFNVNKFRWWMNILTMKSYIIGKPCH